MILNLTIMALMVYYMQSRLNFKNSLVNMEHEQYTFTSLPLYTLGPYIVMVHLCTYKIQDILNSNT